MALASNQIFLKTSAVAVQATTATNSKNIRPNIQTDFNPNVISPKLSKTAYVDPFAVLIGDCDNKFVPPGSIIATQAQGDALAARVGSPYEKINSAVLHVNQELAKGYNAQTIHRLATEIEDQLEEEEMLQTGSPTGNHNATAIR
jgi:hypothetical protein